MPAETLSRDARHLALPQVGTEGQQKISRGTALLIGMGGIGCPAATYLASSGIGKLLICDFEAIRFEGQLAVFGPDYAESPCYRCLYVEADESLGNCAGNGVLAPVPGVIGTLMAAEALKFLAGINEAAPVLRLYDALATEFRHLGIRKREGCPACAAA